MATKGPPNIYVNLTVIIIFLFISSIKTYNTFSLEILLELHIFFGEGGEHVYFNINNFLYKFIGILCIFKIIF